MKNGTTATARQRASRQAKLKKSGKRITKNVKYSKALKKSKYCEQEEE